MKKLSKWIMKNTNYILIVLIFIAIALLGVLFEDLKKLATLKTCMYQPYDQMTLECRGYISENL